MLYWLLDFCRHHLIQFDSSESTVIFSFAKETLLITSKGTATTNKQKSWYGFTGRLNLKQYSLLRVSGSFR